MKFKYVILSFSLFLSPTDNSKADPFYLSQVARLLSRYEEGIQVVNDLKPGGRHSDVTILFLPQAEIKARAGHTGGGVRQNPITKKYEILILDSLSDAQKAHAISHELQHVKDELEFDKYLEAHPSINQMGQRAIKALRSEQREVFMRSNREDADFILKGLFCQEARAYKANKILHNKGLTFQNGSLISNSSGYINDNYVKKFGGIYSAEEAKKIESDCLAASSFISYVESTVPTRFRASSDEPSATVE